MFGIELIESIYQVTSDAISGDGQFELAMGVQWRLSTLPRDQHLDTWSKSIKRTIVARRSSFSWLVLLNIWFQWRCFLWGWLHALYRQYIFPIVHMSSYNTTYLCFQLHNKEEYTDKVQCLSIPIVISNPIAG